jgi:hypothetical protein
VKLEQSAWAQLPLKYDGIPNNLIPTLNAIHIHRQNEVWFAATFITQDDIKLDIVHNFSQLHQASLEFSKFIYRASCPWYSDAGYAIYDTIVFT